MVLTPPWLRTTSDPLCTETTDALLSPEGALKSSRINRPLPCLFKRVTLPPNTPGRMSWLLLIVTVPKAAVEAKLATPSPLMLSVEPSNIVRVAKLALRALTSIPELLACATVRFDELNCASYLSLPVL